MSATFKPYVLRAADESVIVLDPAVIPPIEPSAKLIAPQTLVIAVTERSIGDGLVGDAFPNTIIEFPLDPGGITGASETENEDNWGVGKEGIQAALFWERGVNGQGVKIGIADSGLDSTHPTFAGLVRDKRLAAFAQFDKLGNKEVQRTAEGAVVPDRAATPTASHWHGTHCAAVLVGEPTDGKQRGAAPGAELVVARVLGNSNEGSVAGILAGLSWLADQRCDIVSLSLGWPGLHEEWAVPIKSLLDGGTVVVAAVGNEFLVPGTGKSRSPANYLFSNDDEARGLLIAIGAHDASGAVWDESGGETVDWSSVRVPQTDGSSRPSTFAAKPPRIVPNMLAPGVDIVSAVPVGGYRSSPGSSMATPHAAGLVALILSALRRTDPAARPRQAAELLLTSLIDVAPPGPDDRSGDGRADVPSLCARLFSA